MSIEKVDKELSASYALTELYDRLDNRPPMLKSFLMTRSPNFLFDDKLQRAAVYLPEEDAIVIGLASQSSAAEIYFFKALIHSTVHRKRMNLAAKIVSTQDRLTGFGLFDYEALREETNAWIGAFVLHNLLGKPSNTSLNFIRAYIDKAVRKSIEKHPRRSNKIKIKWGEVRDRINYFIPKNQQYKVNNQMEAVKKHLRNHMKGVLK